MFCETNHSDEVPVDIKEAAAEVVADLMPKKSKMRYNKSV